MKRIRKIKRNGMNGTHGDSLSWTVGLGALGASVAADEGFRPRINKLLKELPM